MLDCWLFWLLHADEFETDQLLELFPQPAMQIATKTLTQISRISEDKAMYDAREKAIRDRQWALNASFREGEAKGGAEGEARGEARGKVEGKIEEKAEHIQTLQGILGDLISDRQELQGMNVEQLQALTMDLQTKIRNRLSS